MRIRGWFFDCDCDHCDRDERATLRLGCCVLVQLQHKNLAVIDPGNPWRVLTIRTLHAGYKPCGRFAIRIADSSSAIVCQIPTFQCSSANGAKGERRTAITVLNPACGEVIGEAPKASIRDLGRAITAAKARFVEWREIAALSLN